MAMSNTTVSAVAIEMIAFRVRIKIARSKKAKKKWRLMVDHPKGYKALNKNYYYDDIRQAWNDAAKCVTESQGWTKTDNGYQRISPSHKG